MASKKAIFDIRINNPPRERGDEIQVKNLKWHKESLIQVVARLKSLEKTFPMMTYDSEGARVKAVQKS